MNARTLCDCGAVKNALPAFPTRLTLCPCDFCRRTGALWAYFPKGSITVTGATQTYARAAGRLNFHRCTICGVLTHWTPETVDWANAGVNMRNMPVANLDGIPIGPPE